MNKKTVSMFTAAAKVANWTLAKRGMNSLVCAVGALLAVSSANAQSTLTWDISTAAGITGGTGPWNTTDTKWTTDGGASNIAWSNSGQDSINVDNATFGGTAGTVTLGEAISLKNLTINTASYIITGSTLNFTAGNINLAAASTIRSAITGSPAMTDGGASGSYTYLNPTSGNMTLGVVTRAVDKHLYLQGSGTSSNSLASIAKGHANAKLYVQSGNWTFGGNVYAGEFYMSGGSLVLNGQLSCDYRTIDLSGGTLHYNNPGAIRDNAASADNLDFRITGGSIDQTSGAAITTSTTNPQMRWNGNWTFIGSNGENSNLYMGIGAIFLNATRQVTVQNAATTLAVGGVISGATFGLTKAGDGTLELRGNCTYTGATTISAGTLQIGNGGTSGTLGSGSVQNDATLVFNRTDTFTVANLISGASSGTLEKTGSGKLILTAANTYSGATTISGGTLVGVVGGGCANSDVTVNNTAGCTVGVGVTDNTQQWTCKSLTSAGTSATLAFGFATTPSTTLAPLRVTGDLTFTTGTPGITLDALNLTAGTYPLIVVEGNAPTDVPVVTIIGAGTWTGVASWGGTGNKTLSVTVSGSSYAPLTWNNGNTGTWDINSSAAWKDSNGATGIKYQEFFLGDMVQFTDNSLTGPATVTLNTSVSPASVTVNNPTRNITIGGTGGIGGSTGLSKSGNATLTLSCGKNSYSGGTVLNAGTIAFGANNDSYLGATSGGLTFGGGQITYSDDFVLNRAVTVNANWALNNRITVTGVLSGSSSISQSGSDTATFSNTGNTFTGAISSSYAMTFASLGDSSNPISGAPSGWTWSGGAKTFALRPFTMTGNMLINSSGSGALVIQQNLAHSGTGARTLTLGGSYTGANQFVGSITNGTGSTVSLTKGSGNSIWALSGINTYTGATTLSYGDDNGILIFQGMQALSPSTSLNQNQPGTNTRAGTIKFLDDSATPASRSTVNLNFSNTEGVATSDLRYWMRVFVGNNSTANGGTSSSTQTGSTIQLGNLNLTEGATASTGGGLQLNGANGYKLQIANLSITLQATTAVNHNATLLANAPLTVTGNVQQANDAAVGSATTLQLDGTATGNLISGNILNSAGGRLMNVTKAGTGTWIFSGANTYSGTTTVSGGTLVLRGEASISDGNTVNLAGGNLNVETREAIKVLQFANVTQLDGIWGAVGNSNAQRTDSRLTGAGLLYVNTPIPASGTMISFF